MMVRNCVSVNIFIGTQLKKMGDWLREERVRLGMSQAELGAAGGVLKQAQLKYEKGERSPDAAYLAAIAHAGIDVMYVLTGSRSFMPPQPITAEHRSLIADYDACSASDRAALRRTAAAMALGGAGVLAGKPRKAGIYVERADTVVKKLKQRDGTINVKGGRKE